VLGVEVVVSELIIQNWIKVLKCTLAFRSYASLEVFI
jgi:hypothetical protein